MDQVDAGNERDLIKGKFQNLGTEARYIKKYTIKEVRSVFLVGTKLYMAHNNSQQGAGSPEKGADFEFFQNPNYQYQSNYSYPNKNAAIFTENQTLMVNADG